MNNYNPESFGNSFTDRYNQEQREHAPANPVTLSEYESGNPPFTINEHYAPELNTLGGENEIRINQEYRSAWLQRESIEAEPSTRIDAPPLIKEDTSVNGYTCYVNINIGKGNYPLTMTGIYIPSSFDPEQPVDVVLYMHGMTVSFHGSKAQIDTYWTRTKLPHYDFRLREEVNKADKNIVLVAPSLGASPNSYKNILSGKKGGLDSYLEQVQAAVNTYIIRTRYDRPDIAFSKIILSGHSAGGSQILRMAIGHNPAFGPRIAECWGFDCLYTGRYVWLNWARKNPQKKLFIYYKGSTKANAEALAEDAQRFQNVHITNSPAKNHYLVPLKHFRERIEKIGS